MFLSHAFKTAATCAAIMLALPGAVSAQPFGSNSGGNPSGPPPGTPPGPPINPTAWYQTVSFGSLTGAQVIALAAAMGVTIATILGSDGGSSPSTPSTPST